MNEIRVAIVGVGNCASSLIQGINFYRSTDEQPIGLIHPLIGDFKCGDIEVVAAFDVDRRKVGKPLHEAIFSKPNCTKVIPCRIKKTDVVVQMGFLGDGLAPHMAKQPDESTFLVADEDPVNITETLKNTGAEILISYLPVGSEVAARYYAQCCLDARAAMINCMPAFIASDPHWADQFKEKNIPIVGDDVKSQLGATIINRRLVSLFEERGVTVDRLYQLNVGGNTDFLNMLDRSRLRTKRISKTQSVRSGMKNPPADKEIHIGPSDYIPWLQDNKVCFIRIEGRGFGHSAIELELRLSVQDSPNSAGVVVEAIRSAKVALQRKVGGPLLEASAYLMKSPLVQLEESEAYRLYNAFISGDQG